MKAYGKFICAKEVELESKSTSGIILSSASDKAFEVVSVGPQVQDFAIGDRLILPTEYHGEKKKIDAQEYFFFNSDIVLGVY